MHASRDPASEARTDAGTEDPSPAERADLYRWFSSVFARELDAAAWQSHTSDPFLSALTDQARALGVEDSITPLRDYLGAHGDDDPEDAVLALAIDYARLFIGPGAGEAPPYESLYEGPKARLYGDAYADMIDFLHSEGIVVDDSFHAPADHAAVELSVMAHLLERAEEGDEAAGVHAATFFRRHLMRWFPLWCERIGETAATDFYRGVSRFLKAFLDGEARRWQPPVAS